MKGESTNRLPTGDYMIDRMAAQGWVLMNVFVDRLGLYDLSVHRWDTGAALSVYNAESWRDGICDLYCQYIKTCGSGSGLFGGGFQPKGP